MIKIFFMKKFFLLLIFSLTFVSKGHAESVYDFLKKEYEYERNFKRLNIYAHNSHPNKQIKVLKLEAMLKGCGNLDWDNPDRVYKINTLISPQSDRQIVISAYFPQSAKKRCYRLWAEFQTTSQSSSSNKKKSTNVYDLLEQQKKKKSKQSGSRSLLEKLLGNN